MARRSRNRIDCSWKPGAQIKSLRVPIIVFLQVNSSFFGGTALHSLVRYFHLHAQGAVVVLTQESDMAFLGYGIYQSRVEIVDQIEDGAVAIVFNLLGRLCGRDWKPSEVCFSHREPRDLRPFRQFFKAPLRFDTDKSGCFFPLDGWDSRCRKLIQNCAGCCKNRSTNSRSEIKTTSRNRSGEYSVPRC
ncbi:MAG TPA: hypothetical protein DDW45_06400 [Gammaproteobacteria bacterium]|nr:hypothetical protein [Gammaproteobacteria bacterium]